MNAAVVSWRMGFRPVCMLWSARPRLQLILYNPKRGETGPPQICVWKRRSALGPPGVRLGPPWVSLCPLLVDLHAETQVRLLVRLGSALGPPGSACAFRLGSSAWIRLRPSPWVLRLGPPVPFAYVYIGIVYTYKHVLNR